MVSFGSKVIYNSNEFFSKSFCKGIIYQTRRNENKFQEARDFDGLLIELFRVFETHVYYILERLRSLYFIKC